LIEVKKSPLTDVLQQLSNKSGVRFAYRNSLVRDKYVFDQSLYLPFYEVLNKILINNRLCYSYQNNQVIIHTNCFPSHYTISGNIYEDSTFQHIPYVAVAVSGKNNGTIADQHGYFELNIPWSDDGSDTLVFSSMGYKRDSIIFNPSLTKVFSVLLKQKFYPVDSVVISPKVFEKFALGNNRDRKSGSLYLDTHGQQTALFMRNSNKNKKGIISSVSYYLSKEGNTDAPFRVRIYRTDSAGMPGKDIIEDAIVVKPVKGEGWYTVNLEKLRLEIPREGIYVAIEGVFPDDYEDYYGESEFIDLREQNNLNSQKSLTYGQRLGYNRKCRKETWHYSISKVWFQLEKQSFGVMISATVKYEKEHEKNKKDD
jgi:hypothetical protein